VKRIIANFKAFRFTPDVSVLKKTLQNQTFVTNALHFAQLLRQLGVNVSIGQNQDFLQALSLINLGSREQTYFAGRGFLVNRQEDLALYDLAFNLFWRNYSKPSFDRQQKTPRAPRYDNKFEKQTIATLMAAKAKQGDPEVEMSDRAGTFSPTEQLQTKDFSKMTEEELQAVRGIIAGIRWKVSQRITRRFSPNPQGKQIDLRHILRQSTRTGGIPLSLFYRAPKIKPRPIIILADISGSMEKYSRLLLLFGYSLLQSMGQVECFAFGTRLSHLTPQLKLKNIDLAMEEASEQVVDWSGGTRIGQSLATFNYEWSRRVLRRGAIVMIVSDGWERGNVSQLEREMRYLQHRCFRLIWLNPRLGNHRYQPLVEGMATALPFIDDFLPIHNLQSLEQLVEKLATL
jgi:uncharacterized protein with von Willebrand factor type A (vWA) domain